MAELDSINSQECALIQYADICLFSSSNPVERSLVHLEDSIGGIISFLNGLGLTLSTEKTKLCVFSRNNKALKPPPRRHDRLLRRRVLSIEIQGARIRHSTRVKFLGMTFQSDLGWSAHINQLKRHCAGPLRILKCLGHTWWRADPRLLLMVFRALLRSRLEYGGFLMQNLTKSLSSQLDKLQFFVASVQL